LAGNSGRLRSGVGAGGDGQRNGRSVREEGRAEGGCDRAGGGGVIAPRRRHMLEGYLFAAPWLVGFLTFTAGAMLYSVWMSLLRRLGVAHPPGWFTDEQWARPGMILMSLWSIGTMMLTFLAGLQSVPEELQDAAQVDGAGAWHRFRHVTLPLLTPTLFFNLVISVIGSFQVFTQSYIITDGGPANATLTYALYLFRNAFQYFKMGYASALAWILFFIILLFTLLI